MGESSHWSAAVLLVVNTTVVMDFAGASMMEPAVIDMRNFESLFQVGIAFCKFLFVFLVKIM